MILGLGMTILLFTLVWAILAGLLYSNYPYPENLFAVGTLLIGYAFVIWGVVKDFLGGVI